MTRLVAAIGLVGLLGGSGCGRLVFVPNNPAGAQPAATAAAQQQQQAAQLQMAQQQVVQQQLQALAQQTQQYQTRAQTLDKDNQELEALLAQSRQQVQLITDELAATRSQLQSTTSQLLALRNDNEQLRTQTSQLVSSAQQRAGAEIRANNSLLKNLTIKDVPGVQVRQDGDVVRIEIAGDRVFMPGSPYLQNGADQLLLTVVADLRRNYPDQILGIEGHTDDAPTHSQQFPSHHHLSVAQALSVYNLVVERGAAPGNQLFVIGHGANHPVVSNASEEGRARNRRIEFVVYPERVAMR